MKQPDFDVPVYDGSLFRWTGRTGYAEASSLRISPGVMPGHLVWRDSLVVGFLVRSHRTGETKLFVLGKDGITRDGEGELLSWGYTSEEMTVIIFND